MAHLTKEFIKNMALAAREIAEAQEEKYGKDCLLYTSDAADE